MKTLIIIGGNVKDGDILSRTVGSLSGVSMVQGLELGTEVFKNEVSCIDRAVAYGVSDDELGGDLRRYNGIELFRKTSTVLDIATHYCGSVGMGVLGLSSVLHDVRAGLRDKYFSDVSSPEVESVIGRDILIVSDEVKDHVKIASLVTGGGDIDVAISSDVKYGCALISMTDGVKMLVEDTDIDSVLEGIDNVGICLLYL